MFRRIALTLGTGVAVLTAAANHMPAREAGRVMSLSTDAGKLTTIQVAGHGVRRSGYIVASS
jgi:hypothetical protein